MTKIKINNNTTDNDLIKIIKNVDKQYHDTNNIGNIRVIIVILLKKIIKYNKLNIFLEIIKSNNFAVFKMGYQLINGSSLIPLNYIYKYAYYYKNINIVMQMYNLGEYLDNYSSNYDVGCIPSDIYDLIAIHFIKYLKNKKSKLYKKICEMYTSEKVFNMQIYKEYNMNILNIFYKYNGKIKLYNDDDCDSCKKIYCKNKLSGYPICNMCSIINCKSINLNEIIFNCNTNKYVSTYTISQVVSCIYLYYKEYENKKINEIDFNLIYNFFTYFYPIRSESSIANTYKSIAKFTLLYCAKYKNLEILYELEKCLSKISIDINLFEIIYFLSSTYNCKCVQYINNLNIITISFNQKNFKIFTKNPYFSIIKQILNNELFYNNLDKLDYISIRKIINNTNPTIIDKIIINQIIKTNITNTHEYASLS